jgi:hypothetical protein
MGAVTEDLYQSLGHFARKDVSGDLEKFCEALGLPLEKLYEIVGDQADGKPGWSPLFDVDTVDVEHLAYLAQFPGARLTPEMSVAQQRAEIKEPSTWKRGTTEQLRTVLKRTLTGSQRVIIRERTPEPWDLYVRTLKSETPDEARTEAVARANKVAGLVMDYEALDGVAWADVAASWEDWGDVSGEFPTWADLTDLLPDELPEP